ncbi:hypothetical protein HDU92_000825 [Lobulomyces angularis]|nr:hypothetical protein HDU92_000825 [Lobulomyces angularis]
MSSNELNDIQLLRDLDHAESADNFNSREHLHVDEKRRKSNLLSNTFSNLHENLFLKTLNENAEEVLNLKHRKLHNLFLNKDVTTFNQVRENYEKAHMKEREKKVLGFSFKYVFSILLSVLNYKFYTTYIIKFLKLKGSLFIFIVFDFFVDVAFTILYLFELQINVRNHSSLQGKIKAEAPDYLYKIYNATDTNYKFLFVNRFAWVFYVAAVLASFNLFNLIIKIIFADRFLKALFSLSTFIDLIVGVPFLILTQIDGGKFIYIPYFLIMIKSVYRISKILRYRYFNLSMFREKLIILIYTVWGVLYVAMCTFNFFETNFQPPDSNFAPYRELDLMESFYFIVITISTVGYGDVSPVSTPGRIAVMVLIIVSLGVIPGLVSDVVDTLQMDKKGGGTFSKGNSEFIVVIGKYDNIDRLKDILSVFIHSDSAEAEDKKEKIVFLMSEPPSLAVESLLNNTQLRERVQYFSGSCLNHDDLRRLQVNKAAAVFILANRSVRPQKEDEQNSLRTWAIDNFAPQVPMYVYTMLPETESYLEQSATATVCVNDLKQAILGFTSLYPGMANFLNNLLNHSIPSQKNKYVWQTQYGDGSGNEIYNSPINPLFVGERFTDISWYIYKEFQSILFAVKVYESGKGYTMLNPGINYKFSSEDVLIFICQNETIIVQIQNLSLSEFKRSYKTSIKELKGELSVRRSNSIRRNISSDNLNTVVSRELYIGTPVEPLTDAKGPLCYLLKQPVDTSNLKLVTCKLTGFILVITGDYDIFKFICALRASHISEKNLKPIVLFSKEYPNEEELNSFKLFSGIFFMTGNPYSKKDLLNAGLANCQKVVLINLSSEWKDGSTEDDGAEDFGDSTALMINHVIHRISINLFKEPKPIIIELQRRRNIKFLKPSGIRHEVAKERKKIFGENGNGKQKMLQRTTDFFYHPLYASGNVVVGAMLDSILFQTYQNDSVLDIFKLFCGLRYEKDVEAEQNFGYEPSFLTPIPLPEGFEGGCFIDLYYHLTNLGIVPLALLRETVKEWSNHLPFVYTNPVPSCLLRKTDLVYVLKKA